MIDQEGTGSTPPVMDWVDVGLTDDAACAMQRLQERTGFSKVDIVNRAIVICDFIDSEISGGRELLLRGVKDGQFGVEKVSIT